MQGQHTLRSARSGVTVDVILPAAIVLLALVLRLWFWYIQARSGAVPPGDPEEYYRAAVHILHGGYHDTGKWLRPPVYPVFLALLLPLSGMNVAGALLLQACVLSAGVLAFYAFGRQLFGRMTGLATALLAALFVPLASYASSLYAEALFITLLIAGLAIVDQAFVRGSRRAALSAGAVLALAALTRAVGLYLLPLVAAWLIWRARSGAPAQRQLAVFLFIGALLVIGPWAARNYLVHGRVILSDTNGGVSMWYGTVRDNAEKAAGEAHLASIPNLADRQSLALQMAWDNIRHDPVRFLWGMRFKIASLYALQTRSYAVGDVISIDSRGAPMVQNAGEYRLGITLLADAQYVALMLLAIGGICFMPQPVRAVPVLLWVGLATLLAAVTIGHPRLRLPIVAAVLPFAAYALVRLPAMWRRLPRLLRDRRGYTACAGMIVFLGLIFSTRYIAWSAGLWYAVPGRIALDQGDLPRAEALLAQAHRANPENPLRIIDLADLRLAQGDQEGALDLYRRAAAMEHRSLYAQAMRTITGAHLGISNEALAGLTAIDDYWRSGNDLLEWAWNTRRGKAPDRVIPGNPAALGLYAGFAPATPDVSSGRWTLGEGRVRVCGGCGTLIVRLHGPVGRTVTISIDDWGIREQVILTGEQQEARLALTSIRDCAFNPELIVRITSAISLIDLEQSPWYVGVVINEVRVEP
ncbi:glycosyltransferase family 39 protein [Roseiflexus sp.]|uniref:glycosyltransferase family 39 protein n=1 Tax=Roseiflexus sp. TaxID=2562120 RepID=UPI00398B3218